MRERSGFEDNFQHILPLAAILFAVTVTTSLAGVVDGDVATFGERVDPGQRIYYVNGINTPGAKACEQTVAISRKLGEAVTLTYVDCSQFGRDVFAITASKIGDFDTELNPAANRLVPLILADLSAGRRVVIIGYSLGGCVAQNVVNECSDRLRKSGRDEALSKLSVILLGAAVFSMDHLLSDGFPKGLRGVFSITDARDEIVRTWGAVDDAFLPSDESRHDFAHYLRHLEMRRARQHGRLMVDGDTVLVEEVHASEREEEWMVRWRVFNVPDETSRRTFNASLPTTWNWIRWRVLEHPNPERVEFTRMIDNDEFFFDAPVGSPVRSGDKTAADAMQYIGRVIDPTGTLGRSGFVIEARPTER